MMIGMVLTKMQTDYVIIGLDGLQFLLLQRRAAVADDAASAFANGIVAGEILQDDILRHEDVPNLDNGSERSLVSHHSMTISAVEPAARADNISFTRAAVTPSTLSL